METKNFYGNNQRGNYNQSSQYQKPYNNNKANDISYYQNPQPQTQESRIKKMLDQVLESQQKLTVDFNGKIDDVYTNLSTKFESLSTHVKKL